MTKFFIAAFCALLVYVTASSGTCSSTVRGACPSPWKQWGNKCYLFTTEVLPREKALEYCTSLGGYMAVPESREEVQFILNQGLGYDTAWVGCKKSISLNESHKCVMSDGKITQDVLAQVNLSVVRDYDECVVIREAANGFHSYACNERARAVCVMQNPNQLFI